LFEIIVPGTIPIELHQCFSAIAPFKALPSFRRSDAISMPMPAACSARPFLDVSPTGE